MGVALLTTIQLLIQKHLFGGKGPIIRNLGLVLALFLFSNAVHSDHTSDREQWCQRDENGWAAEVALLAKQLGYVENLGKACRVEN